MWGDPSCGERNGQSIRLCEAANEHRLILIGNVDHVQCVFEHVGELSQLTNGQSVDVEALLGHLNGGRGHHPLQTEVGECAQEATSNRILVLPDFAFGLVRWVCHGASFGVSRHHTEGVLHDFSQLGQVSNTQIGNGLNDYLRVLKVPFCGENSGLLAF